ncbi:MAG: SBBP repeat-containing protein [Candidatus Omnitrophica bacterium]|nr:SBBP repeat-containing protein [Candidatus Omnitrophota bacterium]
MKKVYCFVVFLSFFILVGSMCLCEGRTIQSNTNQDANVSVHQQNKELKSSYLNMPLRFEQNDGQFSDNIKYTVRGLGYQVSLTPHGMYLALSKKEYINIEFLGINTSAEILGGEELITKSNYFIGNKPENWRSNIRNYSKVDYHNIYKDIDLKLYGREGLLEYDFCVKAGADPKQIRLSISGALKTVVTDEGHLLLVTESGIVQMQAPYIYQMIDNKKKEIKGNFSVNKDNEVVFEVAAYDKQQDLIIDPILNYSSYLGGSGDEYIWGVEAGRDGSIYLFGATTSTDFPTGGGSPYQNSNAGNQDIFVTKLDSSGENIVFSTYIGGSDKDAVAGFSLDNLDNPYVAGYTKSSDFPTSGGAFQSSFGGGTNDGYILKISAQGDALDYSTYFGGNQTDIVNSIAIEYSTGNFVFGGTTGSTNLSTTTNAYQTSQGGDLDGFVGKLNESAGLIFLTYLGGSSADEIEGIELDNAGSVLVTGYTESSGFPTVNPYQGSHAGGRDVIIAQLDHVGENLLYSTFLGGSSDDIGYEMDIDQFGNVFVGGKTASSNFPTQNAFQSTYGGSQDGFVLKLNPLENTLYYSTYFGGSNGDIVHDVEVDCQGNLYTVGNSGSTDLFTIYALKAVNPSSTDGFIAKFNSEGEIDEFSTYIGSDSDDENLYGVDVDCFGNIYAVGNTAATDFPVADNALQDTFDGGNTDGIVVKFNPYAIRF